MDIELKTVCACCLGPSLLEVKLLEYLHGDGIALLLLEAALPDGGPPALIHIVIGKCHQDEERLFSDQPVVEE